MPSVGQVSSGVSAGLSLAKSVAPKALGSLLPFMSNPWTAAAVIGGTALLTLIDKIGAGRRAADKMTGTGGPQDILNKQLAAISASQSSAEEKAQATDKAWRGFLTAANEFAQANPKQSKVVQQAIYQTPQLTTTVQNLLGKNPLSEEYTSTAAPGIATGAAGKNPGPSTWGTIGQVGLNVGLPLAVNAMQGRSVGSVATNPGGGGGQRTMDLQLNPESGQWEYPVASSGGDWQGPNLPPGGGNTNTGGGGNSLLGQLLPQLISGGTSLIGGYVASRAAGRAADTQSAASDRAAELQAQSGREAIDFQRETLRQQQQNQQPWIDAGTGALRTIGDITSAPGYAWNETFTPPKPEDVLNDPAIKFQLAQGQRALDQYLRSKGKAMGGKAVKEVTSYGQGVAAQGYKDLYSRAADEYNTRYNTFANERSAELNPQFSLAGLGQTATNQLGSNLGTTGGNVADIGMQTAQQVANQQTAGANARASGYVGSANAWGNAIANIGNNVLDQYTYDQYGRRVPINRMAA